ncbi:uncharacterized protein TrAFT101_004342 [Trichoderma asperellum]|uniref:uncharacterized protein n=1 Tax=Trichoderma asperellum TaxID=101201 RepID=UPI00332CA156|nr:hypothetical protein TrAFT101_004342 [Trichoderma asperellum]
MSSSTTDIVPPNSAEGFGSSSENEAAPPPQPSRRRQRIRQKPAVYSKTSSKGSTSNSNPASLDQLPVPRAVSAETNTTGNSLNGTVVTQQPPAKGKSSALTVRLDLNLDIELEIKAQIYGSLELTVL